MNNYILNCKSPLLATFHAACCMLPGSSAALSFRLWQTNNPKCLWQYKVQGWFYFIFFLKERVKWILHRSRQVMLVHLMPQRSTALEQWKEQMKA